MRKPRGKGYRIGTNLATGAGVKLWCLVIMFYLKPIDHVGYLSYSIAKALFSSKGIGNDAAWSPVMNLSAFVGKIL